MNGVCILKAEDAARMAVLHRAAFSEGDQWDEGGFADLMVLPSTLGVGIEADIGLKGLMLVQIGGDAADILTLGVARPHRRTGVAGDILKAAGQILGSKGVNRYILDVAEDNLGAIAFYHAHGFERDGTRKSYYKRLDGARVNAILMSRSIAGHSHQ